MTAATDGDANDASAPPNLGTVVSVCGSVVDALFETRLPPINSLLRAGTDQAIIIEVVADGPIRTGSPGRGAKLGRR